MEAARANYSEDGVRRTVYLSLCACWFGLAGCLLLIRVARLVKRSSPRRPMAKYVGHLCRLCRDSVLLASATGGPVMKQVAAEVQKRRLVFAQASIPYSNTAAALVLGMTCARATQPEPRRNSPLQDVCLLAVCFTTLFLWAFPRRVTLKSLDAWSSFVIACVALSVSPVGMESYSYSHLLMPLGVVMVATLFNTHVWLNLAWLFAVSMTMCGTIMFGAEDPRQSVGCNTVHTRMDRASHVIGASFVFAIIILFYCRSVSLAVWYEHEFHTSRNELKAARSVLRGVCDAVVELDSDFRLQDGSSQLVDMLLLNPQRTHLGEDLRSFLASDQDRQKFTEQMGQAWLLSEDALVSGLSAAFHVSMRDSSSIPLDVEVFCVRFLNWEARVSYFVGIRECTDTSPILRDSAPGTRLGSRVQGVPTEGSEGGSSHSSQTFSSVHSEALSCDAEAALEGEPAAWIDILSPSYDVWKCTPTFAQYVDTRGGLMAAMRRSQKEEFINWMQDAAFYQLEGSSTAPLQYPRRLQFKTPAQQRGAVGPPLPAQTKREALTSAILSLDLAQPPDSHNHDQDHRRHDHGATSRLVRILLQEPKLGRAASRAPQSQPRCGTPPATAAAASGRLRADARAPEPRARPEASLSSSELHPRAPADPAPAPSRSAAGAAAPAALRASL